MKRTFTSSQAREIRKTYTAFLQDLRKAAELSHTLKNGIRKACERIISAKVTNILKDVPLEELNRERKGIRIKALRDAGFDNIAAVASAGKLELEGVNGIGPNTAEVIKEITDAIVKSTAAAVKIQLSADSRDPDSTALVQAISAYRHAKIPSDECERIYTEVFDAVSLALDDLASGGNIFKWFFASNPNKERAAEGYRYLSMLRENGYFEDAAAWIEAAKKARNVSEEDAWDDFIEHSVDFFTLIEETAPNVLGNDEAIYGLPAELAAEIREECFYPDGLTCTLRRYQEFGVRYILHQKRVLLGDEMGLGKTVQAIAATVSLKNTGATHFLVVCPLSVLANWGREVRRHSRLHAIQIHGPKRNEALAEWIVRGGVGLLTYETASMISLPADFRMCMLTADEAHYIKNPKTKRSQAVKMLSLHADRLLYMTGTALENRTEEMLKLIRDLQPAVAMQAEPLKHMITAPQFREKVAPVYYRRKREDVLSELPELIENQEWCTMNAEEWYVYKEAVLAKDYAGSRRVSWNVDDYAYSSKAQRLLELIETAEEEGRKVIVFSFFLDTVSKVCSLTEERCYGPITGAVPAPKRQKILDAFEKAPAGSVLVSQIQAGGTGLNIQSASVVVICEPQLKPSTENQAISRAYRMGQPRNVLVFRLLCEDTIEERIMDMLANKQDTFDAFADHSAAAERVSELDAATLNRIIEEEIEKIREENRYAGL